MSDDTGRDRRWIGWAALLVLALAALLRLIEAVRSPVWFDEAYVLVIARRSFLDVVRTAAADIHPPLHFLGRWAWSALGGEGALWQKGVSVALAVGSMAIAFRLGSRMFDRRAGLIALALVAVNTAHVRYSQEIEIYSASWLLSLLTVDSAWSWIERRRLRDAVGLVLWASVACYAHYVLIALVAAVGLWGVIALRREARALRTWLLCFVAVALLFLPQAVVLAGQFQREGAGAYFRLPSAEGLYALWRGMSFGTPVLVPALAALALVPLLRPGPWRRPATLLWLLCTLPLLSARAWVLILPREAYYMIGLWLLLAAAGLAMLPGRATPWVLGALLVGLGGYRLARHEVFAEAIGTGRAVTVMRERGVAGDLIVHAESHSLVALLYYMPRARNRLLLEPDRRAPYFDGGLAVPDSCYLTPEAWARARAAGEPWWGMWVNRAFATRGTVTRAGAASAAVIHAAGADSVWRFPPVTVWRGGADLRE